MAEVHGSPLQTSRTYTITGVTEGEMDLLVTLTARVGGDPVKSPRKYADRLYKAFSRAAGYISTSCDASKLGTGVIYMENYDRLNQPSYVTEAAQHSRLSRELHESPALEAPQPLIKHTKNFLRAWRRP